MTINTEPEALLSHLQNSDGSATFSFAGYTVVGAVNGPIEVQRRDELPEEAAVDVIVRPAAGVGGTRERHLESLIQSTLRQIILINNFPRTLIQVVLQVTTTPENEYVNAKVAQATSNLPILPALLQTAVLSLLSAALPLTATLTSTSLAIVADGQSKKVVLNPSPREIETSQSFHVFSFTSQDELILAESEGSFTIKEWDDAFAVAQRQCCPPVTTGDGDTLMDDGSLPGADLKQFTRSTLEGKIASDLHWK
ncbi:Exosome complex component RRP46 [Daldinia childiae]|uniref:Exosome complex component RRP46 n=1 Tax=Daldinia childiae TaxID=326645 RepID=UPI0014456295|nr:Exosome complex component RRP46 [Daldinia childiae]KAF3056381.1 Exosome complex component RRP46 [Daldinia childiae]